MRQTSPYSVDDLPPKCTKLRSIEYRNTCNNGIDARGRFINDG